MVEKTSNIGKNNHSSSSRSRMKEQEVSKQHAGKESLPGSELWTDGLICAFEFVRGQRYTSPPKVGTKKDQSAQPRGSLLHNKARASKNSNIKSFGVQSSDDESVLDSALLPKPDGGSLSLVNEIPQFDDHNEINYAQRFTESHWVPIGWSRIQELVQTVKVDGSWMSQPVVFDEGEDHATVADLAAPYWERPGGPTWWCHLDPSHPFVNSWLYNSQWLHPAISVALRDESKLISERMKHLFYEVPVRVAGGLLFELLGQSVGDPFCDEDDIPIVVRSWNAQNFLVTTLHIKGIADNINILGIMEVQELLYAGGSSAPKSINEVITHLASRLSRWDDRLFRKYVFGAADEIELKFVHRRNFEDMNLLSVILNQDIRRLSTQVIRVKWSLHAREEIVFELFQHLRGNNAKAMLERIKKDTREMLEEQEAVRDRLFTIQDVMQSTVRAWLQDRSLRVTHNLAVFGGCGLVLSIITGLFGINVDGIPGAQRTPYAFGLFAGLLFVIGIVLIGLGMLYLGLKKPINEKDVQVRKLELQQLVSMFQHDAETHAKVRECVSRHNLPPTAADLMRRADYILIDG